MFAPAPPAPIAGPPFSLVGITSTASLDPSSATSTTLRVRSAKLNVLEGHRLSIIGRLFGASHTGLSDRVVTLQEYVGHHWRTLSRGRTGPSGRFDLRFFPHSLRSELARVRFAGDALDLPSRHRLGTLNVFRLAEASWYGGGGTLACGGTLTSSTLGVANKTLPCGTMVTLRYGSHSLRVPVVDRGPYVAGREFDLTEATKDALGFGGTGEVWSTR